MKRSLKICHLTETFLPKLGGVQVVVDRLAQIQAQAGHDVTVVCPDYGDLAGPRPAGDYEIKRIFGSTPIGFARAVPGWLRLARLANFDIIHAHNAWPGGVLAAVAGRAGAGTVVTSHGRDILAVPEINYGSRLKPVPRRLISRALRAADCHTVVGAHMVEAAVAAGSPADNVRVVPNFLLFSPPVRHELVRASDRARPFILFVGRLHPIKGADLALKAFAGLTMEYPEFKLLVIGSGEAESGLKELASELGVAPRVDWLGQVDGERKTALTAAAFAFLAASRSEAFCLAVLEAMALGTPVIVPGRPPFTELVDGKNGLLLENTGPEDLAAAIGRLRDADFRARVAEQARKTAAEYTPARTAAMYEAIYEEILLGPHARGEHRVGAI